VIDWRMHASAILLAAVLCSSLLFVVERSTNANVVVYEARLDEAGELDPADPLRITWRLADGRREELSGLERAWAYGADVARASDGGFLVTHHALRSRPMTLVLESGCPQVRLAISGEPAALARVFVDVGRRGLFPSVRSLELVGHALGTGLELKERIEISR
jgi:hypothetical protein